MSKKKKKKQNHEEQINKVVDEQVVENTALSNNEVDKIEIVEEVTAENVFEAITEESNEIQPSEETTVQAPAEEPFVEETTVQMVTEEQQLGEITSQSTLEENKEEPNLEEVPSKSFATTAQEEVRESFEAVRQTISTKTYSATVDKLVGEVKLFNDDDADLGIEKKRKIWPIILVLLLLGIIGFCVWYFVINEKTLDFGNKAENEENKVEEEQNKNIKYRYEEKENGIEFYNDQELVDTYSCEGCKAYVYGRYEYFSSMPTVIAIQENDNVFLYDYTLKKVISDNYKQLQNIKSDGDTVLFIVTTELGTVGLMNIAGELVVPTDYEGLGYSISGGDVSDYDYKKDIITAKKNGYWGAINFKGEEIIPFEYEDIYYNGYNGIVVCVEGYWYLHNLNNNRLIEDGFDIMIPIKSYVFASSEKVFYVLNYKGESIIEKEIPTYLDTFRSRNDAMVPTFKIEEEGTVVNIYIMENETDYDQYKFNTVNGELTEIIQ